MRRCSSAGVHQFQRPIAVAAMTTVPSGLAVEVTSSGGDVVVRGAVGQLVLRSSAGVVRGEDLVVSDVVAHSSVGDVTIRPRKSVTIMD